MFLLEVQPAVTLRMDVGPNVYLSKDRVEGVHASPTDTLGCGSWGNNSISENLDYKHLINVSRIAYTNKDEHISKSVEVWG